MSTSPADLDHLALLSAAGQRFAEVVAAGPLDAPVAACPGWTVRELTLHMGEIHRWARQAALTGERPQIEFVAPTGDGAELAAWLREGLAALLSTLAEIDPAAPTWHPFPVPRVAGVWPRRQAHETTLHRWDAEHAVGATTPIDPALASDGIDEYLTIAPGRLAVREGIALPTSTLHVHCTDTAGEWLIRTVDGQLDLVREHAKGDAALRGPAEALLLQLWGRPVADGAIEIVGDPAAAQAWLDLGGL